MLSRRLLEGREPHAILIVGPPRVGRRTLARAYARALLCTARIGCGQCSSCRRFDTGSHPDFVAIYPGQKVDPEDKGEAIQIKAIRHFVLPRVTVGPAVGHRLVVAIEDADRMTLSAANAVLKTLEEPPEWMRFVLTASASDAVPPTVLSRCVLIALGRAPLDELRDGLRRRFGVEEKVADEAASLSSGLPGKAIRFLEDPAARDRAKRVAEFAERLSKSSQADALVLSEHFAEASMGSTGEEEVTSRVALGEALLLLAECFRDAAVLAIAEEGAVDLLMPVAAEASLRLSRRAPATHWAACASNVLEARNHILGNAGARYQLDALLARILSGTSAATT